MIELFVFFVQWSPVNQGFHVTEMGELNTQVDGVFFESCLEKRRFCTSFFE